MEEALLEPNEKYRGKGPLPLFESSVSSSAGPSTEARVRVRLARLQIEAQDRAQIRQAELELRKLHQAKEQAIQICRLELDAELRLRQLELQANPGVPLLASGTSAIQTSSVTQTKAFDIAKHIALVPPFRETKIDKYFNVFERVAATLHWPKHVWPLLLQCKLTGKAQEIYPSLSLEDSLQYECVKTTVLSAYELVPEA